MRVPRICHLLSLLIIMAIPGLAQEKKPAAASSTPGQNVTPTKSQAKLKKVNRQFNKRYGKKAPRSKAKKVRIDESKNQVRVFNKEAPTNKTTANTASSTRPNATEGRGQTAGSSAGKDPATKTGAQSKVPDKNGAASADKSLQKKLRQNETIRHKGDEARVKRNLAKLKKKMTPGEISRANKALEAAKAKDAARAAEAAKAARAAEAAKAARAAEAAKAARAAEAAKAARAAEAAKAARAAEAAKAVRAAEAAKAARAAEAAKAARAAEAAKAARAAQAAKAARAAQLAKAARAAAAGRGAVTAARTATATTGVGIALVAGSMLAEAILVQELQNPGKTAGDISGFFNGLVGRAAVSAPDKAPVSSNINDTFRIENGKAVVRAVPNGQTGYTTIQFATNLDWWTALVIRDRSGKVLEIARNDRKYRIQLNGRNGGTTNAILISTAYLPAQVQFEFWTAKTFGIHKQLVIMKYRRERLDGRNVGIAWFK